MRLPRIRALLLIACTVAASMTAMPSVGRAAAPSAATWTVSDNQAGADGVTYTYSFTTRTDASITSIVFAVSGSGLGGIPSIAHSYGIGAGTVTRSGQSITYAVADPVIVPAGATIEIAIDGLVNTSVPGTEVTRIATGSTLDAVATNDVEMAATRTEVTVRVMRSIAFTIVSDSDGTPTSSVRTNDGFGYTLATDGATYTATLGY